MSVSEKTRKVFTRFDKDNDGLWTESDFREFLVSMGRGDIGDSRTKASFHYLDTGKSGKITAAMLEKGIHLLHEADFYFGKPKSDDDLSTVRLTVRNRRYPVVVKPDLSDPTLLYTLVEKVGEGSYGEIFKSVLKSDSQKTVALKIIDLEKTQDDLDELLYEVDFQAKCFSPHLARYFGSWIWMNKLYIAMEYLGGGTAAELLEHAKLSEEQCSYILREVLKGLDYMHADNRIHRDIKAENILFDNWGALKLADFGVAGQIKAPATSRTTFVGTPLYMAPEIVKGDPYGCAVDLWSVGILAIELATGHPPRSNMHPMDILYATVREEPPLPKDKNVSPKFQDFIKQCLTKDPNLRATARQLLDHPFTQSERGPEVLKDKLDKYWMKRKEMAGAAARTVQNDDSWWQQYAQQTTKSPAAPLGARPSAEAKASIRGDLAAINPAMTFGKGKRHNGIEGAIMRAPARVAGVSSMRGAQAAIPQSTILEAGGRLRSANDIPQPQQQRPQPRELDSTRPGVLRPSSLPPPAIGLQPRGMMIPQAALLNAAQRLKPAGLNSTSPTAVASPELPAPKPSEVKRLSGGKDDTGRPRSPSKPISPAMAKPADLRAESLPAASPSMAGSPALGDAPIIPKLVRPVSAGASRQAASSPATNMPAIPVLPSGESSLKRPSIPSPTESAPLRLSTGSSANSPAVSRPSAGSRPSSAASPIMSPLMRDIASEAALKRSSLSPSERPATHTATPTHQRQPSIDETTASPTTPSRKASVSRPPTSPAPPKFTKTVRTPAQDIILDLSEAFQLLLSDPSYKDAFLPGNFLKCLDELYNSDVQYMETLVCVMEVYVRPLMQSAKSRSATLKEASIKTIFSTLSPLHAFSTQLQNAILGALETSTPGGTLIEVVTSALEELMLALEQLYTMYAEQFCGAICEIYHCMRDSTKFRDFATQAEQNRQCGGRSLYDLLRAPFARATQYAILFGELGDAGQVPSFENVISRISALSRQLACDQENAERLLGMLVQIANIPPAMITKRGQRLLMEGPVDKVKLNSQGSVATRSPIRLYVLKDAMVITKVIRENAVLEEVDVRELLNPASKVKPQKQALQYKDLQLREFVRAEPCGGRDGERGASMFSAEVTLKKGRVYVFSAVDVETRARWIETLNPAVEA